MLCSCAQHVCLLFVCAQITHSCYELKFAVVFCLALCSVLEMNDKVLGSDAPTRTVCSAVQSTRQRCTNAHGLLSCAVSLHPAGCPQVRAHRVLTYTDISRVGVVKSTHASDEDGTTDFSTAELSKVSRAAW